MTRDLDSNITSMSLGIKDLFRNNTEPDVTVDIDGTQVRRWITSGADGKPYISYSFGEGRLETAMEIEGLLFREQAIHNDRYRISQPGIHVLYDPSNPNAEPAITILANQMRTEDAKGGE